MRLTAAVAIEVWGCWVEGAAAVLEGTAECWAEGELAVELELLLWELVESGLRTLERFPKPEGVVECCM